MEPSLLQAFYFLPGLVPLGSKCSWDRVKVSQLGSGCRKEWLNKDPGCKEAGMDGGGMRGDQHGGVKEIEDR